MSVIDAIDQFDKLEFDDIRSFTIASTLIAKSLQQYNSNPSAKFNELQLLFETE
jgi:hypothetical protein